MKKWLIVLGVGFIAAYATLGTLFINHWALTTASDRPLPETIALMEAAGQPYDAVAGILFAGFGIVLGLAWAIMAWREVPPVPPLAVAALWCAIVTAGAPALFFAAFGNINSIGDTLHNWNSGRVLALEIPFYLASALALVIAMGIAALAIIKTARGSALSQRR